MTEHQFRISVSEKIPDATFHTVSQVITARVHDWIITSKPIIKGNIDIDQKALDLELCQQILIGPTSQDHER